MTDRYKGYLITLDKEISSDDAEGISNALKMIKGVYIVKPYVNGSEDWMMYEKGVWDTRRAIMQFMSHPVKEPKE